MAYIPYQLTITINREQLADIPDQVELSLTNREWPLKIVASLLKVAPEDFLIQGVSYGIIEVPQTADSLPLTFTLIPQSIGKKIIHVLFEQIGEARHNYVAMTSIETEVVATPIEYPGKAEIRYTPAVESAGTPPDVTLYILHKEGLSYAIRVRTAQDKEGSEPRLIDTIIFPQPPDTYLKEIFDALDEKTGTGLSALEFDNEVKKLATICTISCSMRMASRPSTGTISTHCLQRRLSRSSLMSHIYPGKYYSHFI